MLNMFDLRAVPAVASVIVHIVIAVIVCWVLAEIEQCVPYGLITIVLRSMNTMFIEFR